MNRGSHDSKRARSIDRREFLSFASAAVATSASALVIPRAAAQSATYPARPLTFVVAYTPGSAPDILARIFASELPAYLGQNVVVENKAGAGGALGTAAVARAKSDGYGFGLVSTSTMAINPAIFHDVGYDPLRDFTLVIKLVANMPSLLLVPAQSPATSVQDLMRSMKERKKENSFRYNSIGSGTIIHLLGVLLVKMAGASADHVPYRTVGDQLSALVSGEVDFGFAALPSSIGFVKSGRLRALGITSARPSPLLPDVPSLSSAGLEEFNKTGIWFGVAGPKEMPDAVTQTLRAAFGKALSKPDIQAKLVAAGYDPAPLAPASEFALFMRDQVAFWGDLVKGSGATVD